MAKMEVQSQLSVSCFVSFAHDTEIFPFLYPAFDVKIKREILLFACKLLHRLPIQPASHSHSHASLGSYPSDPVHPPTRYAQTLDPTQSQHFYLAFFSHSSAGELSSPAHVESIG